MQWGINCLTKKTISRYFIQFLGNSERNLIKIVCTNEFKRTGIKKSGFVNDI